MIMLYDLCVTVCVYSEGSALFHITIIFMILYMYIAPRQGLKTSWGRNFYVNRNILSPFGQQEQIFTVPRDPANVNALNKHV